MGRQQNIFRGLAKAHKKAEQFQYHLERDKWIIFSDHHRGIGDGADDFAPCKQAYLKALDYYHTNGYGLIILGDAEEFWENTLKSVISRYADVLKSEKRFHARQKLIKVWGNHDDAWQYLDQIRKHLFPFFSEIKTFESINFAVMEGNEERGNIFMLHGHQGNRASDRFAGISKWFVRVIWRNFQRVFKFPLSTPAKSKELKDVHDQSMHLWAKVMKKMILVSGHTHQPVFMSRNHLDVLKEEFDKLGGDQEVEKLEMIRKMAELEEKTTAIGTLVKDSQPCYFNTGCCSFADGDITGIELEENRIRLIKWDNTERSVISSEGITDIFEQV